MKTFNSEVMSSSEFTNDNNDYNCKPQTSALNFRKTIEIRVHMGFFLFSLCSELNGMEIWWILIGKHKKGLWFSVYSPHFFF